MSLPGEGFLRRMLGGLRHRGRNARASVHPRPVLVVGNQKSGTSAVAGLLAELTGSSVTQDIFYWTHRYGSSPAIREQLFAGIRSIEDLVDAEPWFFAQDIVKEPSLTFFVEPLRKRFPQSPVVFIVRDPRDNIRSLLDRLGLPGQGIELEAALRSNPLPGWEAMLRGRDPAVAGEGVVERLAHRWVLAARVLLDDRDRFELVRYEDFVADKLGTLTGLAEAVGLVPSADVSDRLDHSFQPAGKRDRDLTGFFGAEGLARIEGICGEEMAALDYVASA